MEIFNLPINNRVNRVIPKNTFDSYTNTKQKKLISDKVQRITWTHKLSKQSTNLVSNEIQEIQLFKIELKLLEEIPKIIEIIDKAIPYSIVFVVQNENKAYISTSVKHAHLTNEDIAVIDWTFCSNWLPIKNFPYKINLKGSLDDVHKDLCLQISGSNKSNDKTVSQLVEFQKEKYLLESEIKKLKQQISRSRSFKKKVELNLLLKEKEKSLKMKIKQ